MLKPGTRDGVDMKIALYCSCGGVMKGSATPDSKAEIIIAIWHTVHSGDGHNPVDAKRAAYARRKAEQSAMKKE